MPPDSERLATIETKLDNVLGWVRGIDEKVNGMAGHEVRIVHLETWVERCDRMGGRMIVSIVVSVIMAFLGALWWIYRQLG